MKKKLINVGHEEWWCYWYKCPFCEEENIAEGFKFCPDCGKSVKNYEHDK